MHRVEVRIDRRGKANHLIAVSRAYSMNRQGTTLKAIIPAEVKTWQFLWP